MGFLDHVGLSYLWGKVKVALGLKMDTSVYDPTGKSQDVFGYADAAIAALPVKKLVGTAEHPVDLDTLTEAGRYYIEGELVEKAGDPLYPQVVMFLGGGIPMSVERIGPSTTQTLSSAGFIIGRGYQGNTWDNFNTIFLAVSSNALTATLRSSAWTGSAAPFTQTVAVSDLEADTNGNIGLSQSATAAQRAAARAAMLCVTGQASGSLTVTADGEKPTVDIPVTITILG